MDVCINGKMYKGYTGQTVLSLCRANDIYVPSLCYHFKTGQPAHCRLCVIEVEGKNEMHTSCNLSVWDGLSVKTDSPQVINAQRVIVDLLLSSGNHDCLSCEKNGMCELQDAAYYLGIERPSFFFESKKEEIDDSSEMIRVDRGKCIQCGRCVSACKETVVHDIVDFGYRGYGTRIIFDDDKKMGDSNCTQCGECVQLCPVGALIDKKTIGQGRVWELEKVETVCPYCGVGCKIFLHINKKKNSIVKISGVEDASCNKGMLCIKGRYGFDFVGSKDRLTKPLLKQQNGSFENLPWEEAISFVANRLTEIKNKYGSNSLGGLASAKATNEDNYVFQKFMRREIGTNNVDHCARLCHSSTVAGLAAAFGSAAMTNDITGIDKSEVILVIGSDTSAAHPVIAARIKKAVKDCKARLIVIDPKKIDLADYADIYVSHRPGTDVALLNGLMQIIIKNGWEDKEFLMSRCENFDAMKNEVMKEKYSSENVERICDLRPGMLVVIAEIFAKGSPSSIFYSMGITQHTTGTDNVKTIANLQMLCGNLGKKGGGVNPLRGQCNVQGACDMGCLPNVYPSYQPVSNQKIKQNFETAWGKNLSSQPGFSLTEMIERCYNGEIKALYIMGENPFLSEPDQKHVSEALSNLEFLVVQDIFLTETAHYANIVLPATSFAEKDGHFTNTDRRVQRLNQALKPPGEAKNDWEIVQLLANEMGSKWKYRSAEDICSEINELAPSYKGITWERVGRAGIQWPCPTTQHPGTPYLHKNFFSRGLGMFHSVEFKEPAELPDQDFPLILTTGRVLQQFHTGTMTRKTPGLNRLARPAVMISVELAEKYNITNNEEVKVSTRRGSIRLPVFITKRIFKNYIFIPFHFSEAPANRLTNRVYDPVAGIPEYKVCSAKIIKINRKKKDVKE